VLSYVPPRMWGGNPDAIFDIGLFYGPGARLLFPIGWLAGSVVAQVQIGERDHVRRRMRPDPPQRRLRDHLQPGGGLNGG
jgi:hypothetical protein